MCSVEQGADLVATAAFPHIKTQQRHGNSPFGKGMVSLWPLRLQDAVGV
jgi:hypothetical protein